MGKSGNRGETEKGENMEWSTVGWGHMTGMGQFRQAGGGKPPECAGERRELSWRRSGHRKLWRAGR